MTGTSMATPAAAGAALLVRSYFMSSSSNFWPGMCNTAYSFCRTFTPSGVLVKAVLLHSGAQMSLFDGSGNSSTPLGAPPDCLQGFGRVMLAKVLPLKGVYTSFDLFVDDLHIIAQGQTVTYTVTVTTSKPIK